ncbi:hypothetical protein VPNG_07728 [Cytospora leucostoma]|uniref:Uncharacterized protein n=1 Tax=Cytospora leucostoma TaxID=1230097 RepID=A0A423W893_9PEZI|nr:hypothetical protein VPNG_07728 [Cytospora leucostoma]
MGVEVLQGWVGTGVGIFGGTAAVGAVAVAIYCHRRGRARVAEAESGIAIAAYAAAVATAGEFTGGDWRKGMAQAIEAGATTGRREGRVHVRLPRHRMVSQEEAERRAEAEGRPEAWGGEEGAGEAMWSVRAG